MKWIDYREQLGIGFDDNEKFRILSTIFQNYAEQVLKGSYNKTSYLSYCQMIGEMFYEHYQPFQHLSESFKRCRSTPELISKYIAFYNTYKPIRDGYSYEIVSKENVIEFLKIKLNDIGIEYDILKDEDGIFIFPKGVKELDHALVSEPLIWLNEYPNTKNEWIRALKAYSELSIQNASDVADKFRKALERFFQEFFNKTQSLENLKSEYGRY